MLVLLKLKLTLVLNSKDLTNDFCYLQLVFQFNFSRWKFASYKQTYIFWLTHFSPMSYFYTPWKRQKTKG